MKNNKELIEELNEVVSKNYDAVEGFNKAAEKVGNSELRRHLMSFAIDRKRFNQELDQQIRALGGDPVQDGSMSGNLHRAWMDIKTAFSSENEESILEECIRGEKAAIDEYQDLLEESTLPSYIRATLNNQCSEIKRELSQLQSLEHFYDD